MSSTSAPSVTLTILPETAIGALVTARPGLARVFEALGIDYCCGGKQTLAVACASRGLELCSTIARIEAAAAAEAARPPDVNVAAMSLTALADHIEATHHTYLKAELPRLVEMADRVATKHEWRDGRLPEVAAAVRTVAEEMLSHMEKEEVVLFPMVREIEAGVRRGLRGGDLTGPIEQMEAEHEAAGQITAKLRELTDGFTPDAPGLQHPPGPARWPGRV